MVSIQANGISICGGSIITDTYVLTAAWCGDAFPNTPKVAVAGTTTINIYAPRPPATQQSRPIIEIISHPDYKKDNGPNNVAMAKTVFPFTLNSYVSPIPLPPPKLTEMPVMTKAIIAGWGSTTANPQNPITYSMYLMKGTVPVHSRSTCEVAWLASIFGETDICAGVLEGTPTGCTGDVG